MSGLQTVLNFLEQLKENNDREWLQSHKPELKKAQELFKELVSELLAGIAQFEPYIGQTTAKQCIYRIYRDVRFSPDKTPYKTNFGAVLAENGRKTTKALYYVQLEPGFKSFLAGGLYMPEAEMLQKVRQEIDYNGQELEKILEDKSFKKFFGTMEGDKLKRAPKGYDPDHPKIEFLKYKSFLVTHPLSDDQLVKSSFINQSLKIFEAMKPFNDFLNTALD